MQEAVRISTVVLLSGDLRRVTELFDMAKSYHLNLRASYWMSAIPGVLTISGVFFLHFGILHSILLNNLGLTIGVANSFAYRRTAEKVRRAYGTRKAISE